MGEDLANFDGPLRLSERDGGAWWIGVDRIEYSSWLQRDPQYVYLLEVPDR